MNIFHIKLAYEKHKSVFLQQINSVYWKIGYLFNHF